MFLNEEQLLPRMLASLARQTRSPELLLLVDDGSSEGSSALADAFARDHGYARLVRRPRGAASVDRLAQAAELIAFHWSLNSSAGSAPPLGARRGQNLTATCAANSSSGCATR